MGLASALATVACAGNADEADLLRERLPPLLQPASAAPATATALPAAATPNAPRTATVRSSAATPAAPPTATALPATATPNAPRTATVRSSAATPAAPPTATALPAAATPNAAPTASQSPESPSPTVTPVKLRRLRVERAFLAIGFERMVDMAFPDDGSNRAFLVLQPGRIMVFPDEQATALAQEFLDIRARVNDRGNEEGLLGLAFDPEFSTNGHFFVYYTASDPRRSVVSRYTVMADDPGRADAASELVVLEIAQPFSNHNGGQLQFGPDGYLYISVGDGGSGGDPRGNGQDLSTMLGTILRIDASALDLDAVYSVPPDNPFVGREGARPEIWAYGLRNPWRFSFDRATDNLWAADVGQNRFEEVDLIVPGGNYGWNRMEGLHCYPRPQTPCDKGGLVLPVFEYGRNFGCSVTGGYVYRGKTLPSLYGAYVYGDFCSGKIWALRHDGESVLEQLEVADTSLSISSFAEDLAGELYILSFDGKIYRFAP